jgi:hypothetical protein
MSLPQGWTWEHGAREDLDATEWDDWMALAGDRENQDNWFRGVAYTRIPTKAQLLDGGPNLVLDGWAPPEPLIRPGTRVLALGSCFASHFIQWLDRNGYEQPGGDPLLVLVRNPFESVAAIAQQFRWAFDEVDPETLLWIDKSKKRNYATEEKRLAMRRALTEADVFIATLSLSEVWYDRKTGEPLWRVMPPQWHDPERHAFKVMSFSETMAEFETIERIRARWLPKLKIIYTISPQPLGATFRPVSPVTANAASKAIVRAALDEFLRGRGDDLNRIYFYYPGYELVTSMISNPFQPDNQHVYDYVVDFVLDLFARTFTSTGQAADTGPVSRTKWPRIADENAQLSELEQRNAALQMACDERLGVIEELKRVCDERLALIEKLHAALNGS